MGNHRERNFQILEPYKENIINLYLIGLSIREVSNKLNLNKSTVGDFIRSKNISRNDFKGYNNPFYGKTHSEEVKQTISMKNRGRSSLNKGKSKFGSTKYFHGLFIGLWKHGADIRNIKYVVSGDFLDKLWEKQGGLCALSGIKMSNDYYSDKFSRVSLDRIDSDMGYDENNVQLVLGIINIMKNTLNNEQFITYCNKVVSYEHG